ncbi:Ribonuclease H domain [Forsythia ovata]|uniref:Ribonuclease H domain n=1 Tax=Forsythia ovata TaxID=205694 RepID=A0ABD1WT48_9LAMI
MQKFDKVQSGLDSKQRWKMNGVVMATQPKKVVMTYSMEVDELFALHEGLQLVHQTFIQTPLVECDSLYVVQSLQNEVSLALNPDLLYVIVLLLLCSKDETEVEGILGVEEFNRVFEFFAFGEPFLPKIIPFVKRITHAAILSAGYGKLNLKLKNYSSKH